MAAPVAWWWKAGRGALATGALLFNGWAAAALGIDGPWALARGGLPVALLLGSAWAWRRWGAGATLPGPLLVLGWWLSLAPSDTRAWQPDVARTAWAEVHGDRVTLHDVRACAWPSEAQPQCAWTTRALALADVEGVDLFVNYWGSPDLAHPILSFRVRGQEPVAISVETRKEVGEAYSALQGFFRVYELIYLVSTEEDLVRVRTNVRRGEDVYLYRTTASASVAQALLLDMLARANALHARPEWYHALTSNCTTNPEDHLERVLPGSLPPWDYRKLLNGTADELLAERGALVTSGLPFAALKARAHVNEAAQGARADEGFWRVIRRGRPGFE